VATSSGLIVDARGENFEGRIVGLEGCASVFLSRAAPTLPLPSVCRPAVGVLAEIGHSPDQNRPLRTYAFSGKSGCFRLYEVCCERGRNW
jgi:hypothetical protein